MLSSRSTEALPLARVTLTTKELLSTTAAFFVNNMKSLDIGVEFFNYGTLELAGELTTRSGW